MDNHNEKMENITDISVGPMPASQFLKPLRMKFKQNGKQRFWDFVKLHESVSAILFNTSRNVLVFVKQFRPAVLYNGVVETSGTNATPTNEIDWTNVDPRGGITIELCAGIVDDSKLSLAETIKKEVLEECGYDVPLSNFQYVIQYRSGIGVSGDKQSLFYAEITDAMKVTSGGGLEEEGELIDVVELTIPELKKLSTQEKVPSPGGFLFAITWFLANKAPKNES